MKHIRIILILTALLLCMQAAQADASDSINITNADAIWNISQTTPSIEVTDSSGASAQVFSMVFVSNEDADWKEDIVIPSSEVTDSSVASPQVFSKVFVSNEDAAWKEDIAVPSSEVTDSSSASPQIFSKVFVSNEDAAWMENIAVPTSEVTDSSGASPQIFSKVFVSNEDAAWMVEYADTFVTSELLISIDYPAAYQLISTPSVVVSGTSYSPYGIANVTVNDILANGTANWSTTIHLTTGVNTITVKATDNMTYSETRTIDVFHFTEGQCSYLDTDGDGVIDDWDQENDTESGFWVNSQGIGRMLGDFNDNGMLDSGDVTILMRMIVGLVP